MDTIFQYYTSKVKSNTPLGSITLSEFVRAHTNPKPQIKEVFKTLAETEDKATRDKIKSEHLHYFTPCVMVNGRRRYDHIHHWTGLAVLDFDKIEWAEELRDHIFDTYPFIVAAWISPSGRGTKALARIPVVHSVLEFKRLFWGLEAEMCQFVGFDSTGQNCVLPLFQSYDPNLRYREDAHVWTTEAIKQSAFDNSPISPPPDIHPTDQDKSRIIKMIDSGFHNIIDVGHPLLRGLCVAIGGYISSGYISELEALSAIDYHITTHHYLKKNISGYKETARWAINIGKSRPLTLSK